MRKLISLCLLIIFCAECDNGNQGYLRIGKKGEIYISTISDDNNIGNIKNLAKHLINNGHIIFKDSNVKNLGDFNRLVNSRTTFHASERIQDTLGRDKISYWIIEGNENCLIDSMDNGCKRVNGVIKALLDKARIIDVKKTKNATFFKLEPKCKQYDCCYIAKNTPNEVKKIENQKTVIVLDNKKGKILTTYPCH